jgi:hypothetical protein
MNPVPSELSSGLESLLEEFAEHLQAGGRSEL